MELTRISSFILTSLLGFSDIRGEKLKTFGYVHYCLFLIFSCFSATMGQPRPLTCPKQCRCIYIEGRLTAECSGSRLTSIPGPLPLGAMIVRFDNNPIGDSNWLQESEYFVRVDRYASDWLELSMRNCNISSFRPELFWGLANLNKLSLSRNKLTKIPTKPDPPAPDMQDTFTPFRYMAKLRVSNGFRARALFAAVPEAKRARLLSPFLGFWKGPVTSPT